MKHPLYPDLVRLLSEEDEIWSMNGHAQSVTQILAPRISFRRRTDLERMGPEFADKRQRAAGIVGRDPVANLAKVAYGPRRKDDRLQADGLGMAR